VPAIVATPPAAICYSPGLFVSPGSPSFVLSSESSLVEVRTDVAAIVPSAVLASPRVIVPALAPSSSGLSGLVRPSPRVPLPSQGKTQCNALLRVNRILANAVGRTGEAYCGGCLQARKLVCWVGEPNPGRSACALCTHRAQGCNAVSCLRSSFPPYRFGLLTGWFSLGFPGFRFSCRSSSLCVCSGSCGFGRFVFLLFWFSLRGFGHPY